jgi:hypothetical protein
MGVCEWLKQRGASGWTENQGKKTLFAESRQRGGRSSQR